jgi:type IV pilus assembly protein PilM
MKKRALKQDVFSEYSLKKKKSPVFAHKKYDNIIKLKKNGKSKKSKLLSKKINKNSYKKQDNKNILDFNKYTEVIKHTIDGGINRTIEFGNIFKENIEYCYNKSKKLVIDYKNNKEEYNKKIVSYLYKIVDIIDAIEFLGKTFPYIKYNPVNNNIQVGLDIGVGSIKLVCLKAGVLTTEICKIPVDITEEERVEVVVNVIKELVKNKKIKQTNVNCVLSGDFVFIQQLKLPLMGSEELKNTVEWEAKKYIPSTIKNPVIDFLVLGQDKYKDSLQQNVILVVAEKDIFSKYIMEIKKAGFKNIRIGAVPFSLLNLFNKVESAQNKEICAIVDIGANKINISVLKEKFLVFNRQIPVGSANISRLLSKDLNISLDEAEELKENKKDILTSAGKEFAIIRPVLEQIYTEIERSFIYGLKAEKVGKILLVGGGAKINGLDKYLSDKLGIEVSLYKPVINEQTIDAQFIIAAGTIFDTDENINLFSRKLTHQGLFFLEEVSLKAAVVLLFTILFSIYMLLSFVDGFYSWRFKAKKSKLVYLRAETAKFQEKSVLERLTKEQTVWPDIFISISKVIPENTWLTELSIDKQRDCLLIGSSLSNQEITEFLVNLNSNSLFKNVRLESTDKVKISDSREIIIFKMQMNI